MYKKIQDLNKLISLGINVHEFNIPEDYNEYKNIILKFNNLCSIRCDHESITKDLPFFVINKGDESFLNKVWEISKEKSYKLIIANGLKYDKIQNYNIVVRFTEQREFIAEISPEKVPLRYMYRYPENILSISGNIDDSIRDWYIINQVYGLDKRIILDDLKELFDLNIRNKWIECTFYPSPVGLLEKNYVVWQIGT